ncbi:hypothetical protein [Paraburkholderia sp.]|uniref:hypothetical protein n=1 Tax=Paraburkholderia sp. TaxID=1926495 RepID=UPI003D6FCFB0
MSEIEEMLARLRRVRALRSQLARVAAARQQGVAAESRRVLDNARQHLDRQVSAKAAIQQRLAAAAETTDRSARTLHEAAADTRTMNLQIGTANSSIVRASATHKGHETELAQRQRAVRRAKAAEDKLEKVGERTQRALTARSERADDEISDAYAVRRFTPSDPDAFHTPTPDPDADDDQDPADTFRPDTRC